jgi:hypothetical protein
VPLEPRGQRQRQQTDSHPGHARFALAPLIVREPNSNFDVRNMKASLTKFVIRESRSIDEAALTEAPCAPLIWTPLTDAWRR